MQTQVQDAVGQIRSRIEQLVGPQRYKVWFKNSTQLTCADGFLKVGVPNLFIGGWIEDHFADAINQAAREVLERDINVSYSIDPVLFRQMRKTQLAREKAGLRALAAAGRAVQDKNS